MTAAENRREELEAVLHREKIPAVLQAKILAAADAYAKAFRRDPKPPAPAKPRAVHFMYTGRPRPACRPFDLMAFNNWPVTADLEAVTCGHCRRIFVRAGAGGLS